MRGAERGSGESGENLPWESRGAGLLAGSTVGNGGCKDEYSTVRGRNWRRQKKTVQRGLTLKKGAGANDDGTYTVRLEAYVTGTETTTYQPLTPLLSQTAPAP